MKVIDPQKVYAKGLKNIDSLESLERLVYLVMLFEDEIDMQGWNCFFHSKSACHYQEIKSLLINTRDEQSLAVLSSYEKHLLDFNLEMKPEVLSEFLDTADDQYFRNRIDWRAQFQSLADERWKKIDIYLQEKGSKLG